MKGFKGTQGKWEVVVGDDNAPDIISDTGIEIAFTPTCNGDKTEQWHNANLIAAAPELLEALQDLVVRCRVYVNTTGAQAAIAKALGESQ